MRLIDADELKAKLQEHHDFFVNAYGGFKNLPPNDKARVDEITHCISEVVNAPTVNTDEIYKKGYHNGFFATHDVSPTVGYAFYQEAYQTGYEEGKNERPQGEWIPVSERLPDDLEPVNITWINHEPEPYYKEIKDKPFTATGVYFNGQWYWWSTLCTDTLAEYSHNYDDIIDKAIEVVAWRPLPEPYKKGGVE